MREQMLLLKELQEAESLIGNLEKDHQDVLRTDETRQLFADMHALQKNIDRMEKAREELSMQYKREEILLMSRQTQRQQVENSLYGGTVHNNKEMMQIQGRIQQIQDQIEKQENSMMGIMENQETLEQKITEVAERYTQIQQGLKLKERENTAHILELSKQIKALTVVKSNLRERIRLDLLAMYDELIRKNGTAVSWLQGDICVKCRVVVPGYVVRGVREAKAFVYCETCGCLLISHTPLEKKTGKTKRTKNINL